MEANETHEPITLDMFKDLQIETLEDFYYDVEQGGYEPLDKNGAYPTTDEGWFEAMEMWFEETHEEPHEIV